MIVIFEGIINGFLDSYNFNSKVSACGRTIVNATIDLYNQVTDRLLPTPSKFHYTFNLRDISKVFQGFCMCKPISIDNEASCALLWIHEVSRVFYDRLVDEEGREFFKELIEDAMKLKWRNDIKFSNVIFSNILKLEEKEEKDRLYEEIKRMEVLLKALNHYLDEYNTHCPNKMSLIFFSDAVNHICRIVRVL